VYALKTTICNWANNNNITLPDEIQSYLKKKALKDQSIAKTKKIKVDAVIYDLIDVLEARAKEQGKSIDKENMPGKKIHLYELALAIDRIKFRAASQEAFGEWLQGKLRFRGGRGAINIFYKELFPEHYDPSGKIIHKS